MPGYMERTATISRCRAYRYRLGRRWALTGRTVAFVMLNPSTADAMQDDPTIRRCLGFAQAWGYAALEVVNLFALRATDPAALREADDPVGPDNAQHVRDAIAAAGLVVAAWGGSYPRAMRGRVRLAAVNLRAAGAHHLGLTAAGDPRHPLYLPGTVTPAPWLAGA